jgi:hypothetical protein
MNAEGIRKEATITALVRIIYFPAGILTYLAPYRSLDMLPLDKPVM